MISLKNILFEIDNKYDRDWLMYHIKSKSKNKIAQGDGELAPFLINGDIDFVKRGLIKIPYNFEKVTGNFDLSANELKSLAGSPKDVGGYFSCSGNFPLRFLSGGPKMVGRNLAKSSNSEKIIGYNCSRCSNLESLVGAPRQVFGGFDCHGNRSLEMLTGSPIEIFGDFNCSECNLETLYGTPEIVHGDYDASFNLIKNFEYLPKIVDGDFILTPSKLNFEYETAILNQIKKIVNIGGKLI